MKKDPEIEAYYALRPVDYGFLESLKLHQHVDPTKNEGFDILVRLASSPSAAAKFLTLEFKGVRELRIGSLEGLRRLLVDIRSIKGDQLEGLNYRVAENEENAFSFSCREFTAKAGNN